MILSLTGFMGSGKSTVGRLVADALGCPFLDLDALIEKKTGCSIPEIFAAEGESGFRKREAETLRRTLSQYGEATAVLSLGGGALGLSAPLLREKTLCIYLEASEGTLRERLTGTEGGRPLLKEGWEQLLEERRPLYAETAHVILPTDGLSPQQIADEIIIDCL